MLALYKQHGVQMLASGSYSADINLWNLSNYSVLIETLSCIKDEPVRALDIMVDTVLALYIYENEGKNILQVNLLLKSRYEI